MKSLLAKCSPKQFKQASQAACRRLLESDLLDPVSSVGLYLALPTELSPEPLIPELHARGLDLCVPAYDPASNSYFPAAFSPDTPLVSGPYQVREPRDPHAVPAPELLLVPGLAFGPNGRRLGHGGGYYDRMIAPWTHTFCVGLAMDVQWCEDLPTEAHDRPMNALITDQRYCCFTLPKHENTPPVRALKN